MKLDPIGRKAPCFRPDVLSYPDRNNTKRVIQANTLQSYEETPGWMSGALLQSWHIHTLAKCFGANTAWGVPAEDS